MIDSLTRLKVSLADWQQRKADALARLEELRGVLLAATLRGEDEQNILIAMQANILDAKVRANIAEYQVIGLEGAIAYAEGVENGTINPSDGRDTDDWLEQLR